MSTLKRKITLAFGVFLAIALFVSVLVAGIYASYMSAVVGAGEIGSVSGRPSDQIYFSATDGDTRSLLDTALTFLGTPYAFGAASRESADCSGFVLKVYELAGTHITLPHRAATQALYGSIIYEAVTSDGNMTQSAHIYSTADWNHPGVKPDPGPLAVGFMDAVGNLSVLQPGDLLFFNFGRATKEGEDIGHVAMYIGCGQFIHTASEIENCIIKSLYTRNSDGTVTWSSYAKDCIKITHLLDTDSSQALTSDLTGGPIGNITAEDVFALGYYLQQTFPKESNRIQYDKAVDVVNLARSKQTSISSEVAGILNIPQMPVGIDPMVSRNARLAILGIYWPIANPTPAPTNGEEIT